MNSSKRLKVGIISDGKYGERAFQNIKKIFETKWILVPDIPPNVFIEDDLDLDIPECDIYISYVRHPDIILQLAELQKPLILGVLPGVGLYLQSKNINNKVIHAPTMCSLENNTGIPEIDMFTSYFGKPIFELKMNDKGIFTEIKVKRSSLCGSSEAGAKFLLNKEFNEKNLQDFALNICYECRAPRFGHTCDKEVAGINHLVSLFDNLSSKAFENIDDKLELFIKNIRNEFKKRMDKSRILLNQVG
ncbi:MAG: DUF166 family protein [Candidatus Thorarchaeota archaeon]